MKKLFMVLIFTAFSANVYAINSGACSNLIYGRGWWRKYPGMGIGEAGINNMTRTTSKNSTLVGTSDYSSQASTASVDPGVSTKVTQSQTQSTSSWGPCALIGSAEEMRKLRDMYYAQNKDEFLRELSQGKGEHLKVMAFFGRCQKTAQEKFDSVMQSHFSELVQESQDDKKFMDKFDEHLQNDLGCSLGQKA